MRHESSIACAPPSRLQRYPRSGAGDGMVRVRLSESPLLGFWTRPSGAHSVARIRPAVLLGSSATAIPLHGQTHEYHQRRCSPLLTELG